MTQTSDRLLLDLSYSFTGKSESFTNFLKGHFLTANSEEKTDNIAFSFGKCCEGTVNFSGQRFLNQGPVGIGRVTVDEYVEEAVIFTVNKRGIN